MNYELREARHGASQLSTFNFQLSTFNFQLSTFNSQLSTALPAQAKSVNP
jgi:hypothetical protein